VSLANGARPGKCAVAAMWRSKDLWSPTGPGDACQKVIGHPRGLLCNLIHPRTKLVEVLLRIVVRRFVRRMERQHLRDLSADRGPHFGGGPVLLRPLSGTEECLEAREDSGKDDSQASEDPHARVHGLLKCGEDTGSDKRRKHHDRDAQSHIQGRKLVCHREVGL
jgi:hypothetical protein